MSKRADILRECLPPRYMSHVRCHMSGVKCPVSHVFLKHPSSGLMLSIGLFVHMLVCLSVCLCVCVSVHFWGTVLMSFCPHFPNSDVQKFKKTFAHIGWKIAAAEKVFFHRYFLFVHSVWTSFCTYFLKFNVHSCFSRSVNCGAATMENYFQVTVLDSEVLKS